MSTLIARLAGPLQAWGAEPRLRTAPTHPTPTRSGVLGLFRAALGHGRNDSVEEISWLNDLDLAVRIDRPGVVAVDFHTINPLPAAYEQFAWVDPAARGLVPVGTKTQKSGQAPRWLNGATPMVTRRHLIHDAAFLLLAQGTAEDVERLALALANPVWTLALGRKACTPASPLLLGVHPADLVPAARAVPLSSQPGRSSDPGAVRTTERTPEVDVVDTLFDEVATRSVDLVWLRGTVPAELPQTGSRVVLDQPLGSHPQHGYAANQHTITRIDAPEHPELLTWAAQHLTHPHRASTPEMTA